VATLGTAHNGHAALLGALALAVATHSLLFTSRFTAPGAALFL
jgi:hypothetical protein